MEERPRLPQSPPKRRNRQIIKFDKPTLFAASTVDGTPHRNSDRKGLNCAFGAIVGVSLGGQSPPLKAGRSNFLPGRNPPQKIRGAFGRNAVEGGFEGPHKRGD